MKDADGAPIVGIPASAFTILVTPDPQTVYYQSFEIAIQAWDTQTDQNGRIRFTMRAYTSIVGATIVHAVVLDVPINDEDILSTKSFDYDVSGSTSLSDFTIFGSDYTHVVWRSNFRRQRCGSGVLLTSRSLGDTSTIRTLEAGLPGGKLRFAGPQGVPPESPVSVIPHVRSTARRARV